MTQLVGQKKKKATAPSRVWYSSFTVEANTTIYNYVPDVGAPVLNNLRCTASGTGGSLVGLPTGVIYAANDYLNGASYGPLIDAGISALDFRLTILDVGNPFLSIGTRYPVSGTGRGPRFVFDGSTLTLRNNTNTIDSTAAMTLAVGDVISVRDTGLAAPGAMTFYKNGVPVLSNVSATGFTATGNRGIAVCLYYTIASSDNWEVWTL